MDVTGIGLASTAGLGAREQALFVAAGSWGGKLHEFGADEAAVALGAPWMPDDVTHEQRCELLAQAALGEALAGRNGVAAIAVLSHPRLHSGTERQEALLARLSQRYGLSFGARLYGDAGVFEALVIAQQWASAGVPHVAIVAIDSMVDPECAASHAAARTPWRKQPPPPAEAAAVLVVGGEGAPLARLSFAGTKEGVGRDDDDDAVDGAAMTWLLSQATEHHGRIQTS